jgi:hypothetical protein
VHFSSGRPPGCIPAEIDPAPPGNPSYPDLSTLTATSGSLTIAPDPYTGNDVFFYAGEEWDYGSNTILGAGSNPTVLWKLTAAQAGGFYHGQVSMYGGTGTRLEFPRSLSPSIKAYVSLSPGGTGLVQVGPAAGATINLATNTTAFPGKTIPEDYITTFDYYLDSGAVLGTNANFYVYLQLVGFPAPDFLGSVLGGNSGLYWNGWHLIE